MSKLMGDGEGSTETIVLDNCTAVEIAHGAQLSQTQCVTVFTVQQWMSANILPKMEGSHYCMKLIFMALLRAVHCRDECYTTILISIAIL